VADMWRTEAYLYATQWGFLDGPSVGAGAALPQRLCLVAATEELLHDAYAALAPQRCNLVGQESKGTAALPSGPCQHMVVHAYVRACMCMHACVWVCSCMRAHTQ